MKLRFGAVPIDETFQPDECWNKCREPKPWVVAWVISIPISIILVFLFAFLVLLFVNTSWEGASVSGFVILFLALIVIHELIHAILQPDRGISEKTVLGFWLSHFLFYAHYDGERSRENFLLGIIGPFVILSVLPVIVGSYSSINPWWYGSAIILNALFCSGDIFGFLMVMFSVPAGSILRNKGWYTYWRKPT